MDAFQFISRFIFFLFCGLFFLYLAVPSQFHFLNPLLCTSFLYFLLSDCFLSIFWCPMSVKLKFILKILIIFTVKWAQTCYFSLFSVNLHRQQNDDQRFSSCNSQLVCLSLYFSLLISAARRLYSKWLSVWLFFIFASLYSFNSANFGLRSDGKKDLFLL